MRIGEWHASIIVFITLSWSYLLLKMVTSN